MARPPVRGRGRSTPSGTSRARGLLASAVLLASLLGAPAWAQSSFARGTRLDWPGVCTGAFLGLLLVSALYGAAFHAVLRAKFLLWQVARLVLLGALTVSLSSLPLGDWLSGESTARQVAINVLFDASVAIAGPFLAALLEPGAIAPPLRRALGLQPWLVALVTPATLASPCPPAYAAFRDAVLLGVLALLCASLAQAVARGSPAARFQVAAWACLLGVAGASLFHDVVLGRPFELFLYALFPALALEAVLTAVGTGLRLVALRRAHDEARALAGAAEILARTDPLTGLANRRGLEARFSDLRPVALAVIDVDHFKRINDGFGHEVGDAVLVAVASSLAGDGVFPSRIGGEEFVVLIYGGEPLEVVDAARRRVTRRVADQVRAVPHPVTASAGLAWLGPATSLAEAVAQADEGLYAAKAAGRDRTVARSGPTSLAPTSA